MPDHRGLVLKSLHVSVESTSRVKEIVCGVDLHIPPGKIVALVGESGSGKTTAAMSILKLFPEGGKITQGEIWFEGKRLDTLSLKEMQKVRGASIGAVFQDPMTAFNPTLTIGYQIAEALAWHQGISKNCARPHVLHWLQKVGISHPVQRYDAYPFELSGGMRQRALIAMALITSPKLLIADEPTAALDATLKAGIYQLLHDCCAELQMSLLLISHDIRGSASIADEIAVMRHGRVIEQAAPSTLFSSPSHPYTKELLDAH